MIDEGIPVALVRRHRIVAFEFGFIGWVLIVPLQKDGSQSHVADGRITPSGLNKVEIVCQDEVGLSGLGQTVGSSRVP